jgi:Circularly permutated YpsA SLOG family
MMDREGLVSRIVTGGQTGVDRAALDVALQIGLSCGGWCPKGRLAEDGPIDRCYPLNETDSDQYSVRTDLNARDSDGTLILSFGELEGGTKLTEECVLKYGKPLFIVDAGDMSSLGGVRGWIQEHDIKVLNIAGPRESLRPGIVYLTSKRYLEALLSEGERVKEYKARVIPLR